MRARRGWGRSTWRPPTVVQPALVQWVTRKTDSAIVNPGTDGECRKRPQKEPPSTAPPSDVHKTFTTSSHSLTKDNICTITTWLSELYQLTPKWLHGQECTPTWPSPSSSEPQHEDSFNLSSSTNWYVGKAQKGPPATSKPGEGFSCF